MEIEVNEKETRYLSDPAKRQLAIAARKYISTIIAEASRIEAGNREGKGEPEITKVNIDDAEWSISRNLQKRNRSWWFTIVQLFSDLTTLLTGVLAPLSTDKLQDSARMICFIIVLTLAIIFNTIEVFLGRTK